jgi:hypothetical protein
MRRRLRNIVNRITGRGCPTGLRHSFIMVFKVRVAFHFGLYCKLGSYNKNYTVGAFDIIQIIVNIIQITISCKYLFDY